VFAIPGIFMFGTALLQLKLALFDALGDVGPILLFNILVGHVHVLATFLVLALLQAVVVDAALRPITFSLEPIFVQEGQKLPVSVVDMEAENNTAYQHIT
jgi:hypothetical protein